MASAGERAGGYWVALACWLGLIAVSAAVVLAGIRPPAAVGADAAATEFSSTRAMQMLEQFAVKPHPVGAAEHDRVRDYLVGQMQALHLDPVVETHTAVEARGDTVVAAQVSNLVGRLKGTANSRAVMLTAHYDTVDRAPGAGDDGGGVATILETVRALEAGAPLKNDVVVMLTDGEELGLLGAHAAAEHDAWLKGVGVMFNFEGRGDQGTSTLFETSSGNRGLIGMFAKAAPDKTGSSLMYTIYKHLPNDTDFTVFRKAGLAGMNFAWIGRMEVYHTRLDTPGNLDVRGLQQDGGYALGLTRAFGNEDLTGFPLKTNGDAVYFNVVGMWLVHYPETLVRPLALLLTMGLAAVLVWGIRRGSLTIGAVLKGFGVGLLPLVLVPLGMAGAFWLVDHFFGRRMLVGDDASNVWLLLGLVLVGSAVGMAVFRLFRARVGVVGMAAGGVVVGWVLTLVMTWTLPGASYLLFWPTGFAVAALGWLIAKDGKSVGAAWLGALATVVLLVPTVYAFFVGLTLAMTLAVLDGVVVAIAGLLMAPMVDLLVPQRLGWPVVAKVAVLGVVAGVVGVVLSRPSAGHPMPDALVYRVDGASGKAQWVSYDKSTDAWTEKMLGRSPGKGKFNYYGPAEWDAMVADAPALSHGLAEPTVTVTGSSQDGDVRTVSLKIVSGRRASWLHLRLGEETQVVGATIDGEEVPDWKPKGAVAINLFGYNDGGVDVKVRLKGQGCKATLTDEEYGLPGIAVPRPEDRMAWYGSDYTVVSREVSICL
jgi:hypothetical protein